MSTEQEIRHECLVQLYGSREIPISLTHIVKVSRRQGFSYTERDISGALYFLVGQGLADRVVDPATGEVRHRITSKGMLAFEQDQN